MKIRIRRIYMKADSTVGCLQIQHPDGSWEYLCDTLEPHAIPWEDDPFIGQQAGERIAGQTAIPEGRYRVELQFSKTFKRQMPVLVRVPEFKSIVIRTGKTAGKSRGDILVGRLGAVADGHPADNPHLLYSLRTFNTLYRLIETAIDNGEKVWVTVRSHKEWKYSAGK